jgi:nucleoside-diphosphate-sugar epimerase
MIGVTGANGYVGSRILSHLRANGGEAVALVRSPAADDDHARRYALGEPLAPDTLADVELVVHAAFDLAARGPQVRAVNYEGSLPLLDGMAERGGRVILISSLAAFEGVRSDYGRAKLELERAVLERGGIAPRAGVVFGMHAGGLFGALRASVSARALVPLIGGGWQRLFVTHDAALAALVAALASGGVGADRPLFAAHEAPTTLRAIATEIASAQGRRLKPLPVPALPVYLALRCAEQLGAKLDFRSDSVRSLGNPIPLDQVSALVRGPVSFPALSPELWCD